MVERAQLELRCSVPHTGSQAQQCRHAKHSAHSAHALEGTRRNTLIAQGLVAVHPSCAAIATSPSPAAGALAGAAVYCCQLTSCDGGIKQRDDDGGSGCAEALWSTHTR